MIIETNQNSTEILQPRKKAFNLPTPFVTTHFSAVLRFLAFAIRLMAEICRADHTIERRNAKPKARRSLPYGHRGADDHVFAQVLLFQRTIRLKTIIHRLILRVLPDAKFYQIIFELAYSFGTILELWAVNITSQPNLSGF